MSMRSKDLLPVSNLGHRIPKLMKHFEHSQSFRIEHYICDKAVYHESSRMRARDSKCRSGDFVKSLCCAPDHHVVLLCGENTSCSYLFAYADRSIDKDHNLHSLERQVLSIKHCT